MSNATELAAKREEQWQGIGVSRGVAVGRVLRLHSDAQSIYQIKLLESEVEAEVARLREALNQAHAQLKEIKQRAEQKLGVDHAYIFEAHLLILEDKAFAEDIAATVRAEAVNAEWAIKVVTDRLLAVYAQIKDAYLRERGSDIEDVANRVLACLRGVPIAAERRQTNDAVIVAEELLPSTVAELDFQLVRAIISEVGGWTSHAAIIARALGIPAVVGVRDIYARARTGDAILVDANAGTITLHPTRSTLDKFSSVTLATRAESVETSGSPNRLAAPSAQLDVDAVSSNLNVRFVNELGEMSGDVARLPRTLDEIEIKLCANVELPAEYGSVTRVGAHGIGLYRSEFLWAQHNRMPSEDEQYAAYIAVARVAGEAGAAIRLFDLGGDKVGLSEVVKNAEAERNPALGLRAIRLSLQYEEVLRTQARAVLRAAAHGRIDVVLPMIADAEDVRRARHIIDEERAALIKLNREVGAVKVGAMIEVPSAVIIADRLAREVDFFSLGTNDLVQYLLAVDRGNDSVAEWFRSLHPSVLHSIKRTLDAARNARIGAVVCGEMASSPAFAFMLIGLGARELSMTPAAIPLVRRMITNIEAGYAEQIAALCLDCDTANEVEELVRQRLGGELPHVFPPETLPALKRTV